MIIDPQKLSKKYRANVPGLIKAWKKGVPDPEIADRTGINMATLYQIKSDIQIAHRRARLEKKKELLEENFSKRHILLRPLM